MNKSIPFVLNTRLTPTDDAYHNLVEDVLHNGNFKGDRTGTGTYAVVGRMARYSLLNKRSPRLTTKELQDTPEREMFWFVGGSSMIKELRDQKIGIWNSWLVPGTGKYQDRTLDELVHLVTRKIGGDDGTVNLTTPDNFAKIQEGKGINTYGKCIVKLTTKESGQKTVAVYGSTVDFASVEAVINYIAIELGIALRVLTDGDIGPGGYGPQWRHWQDTQIVSQTALHDYHKQGYTVRGEIGPVGLPDTEEALLTELDRVAGVKGYVHTDVVKVSFDEVGDKGYDVYNNGGTLRARYHDEDGLRKIFTVIADLPRFVVHREIDQLVNAIQILKHDPNSRRIIVTAWNPALTWKAALPPCFEAGTLVATPDGYKAIEEIEEGEMVLSGTGVPRRVNKKWVTPYTGEMISLKVGYVGPRINCTPNHPFLVKDKGYVEAKDMLPNDFIGMPKTRSLKDHTFNVTTNRGQGRTRTESVSLTVEDYYTLGYFMGNGWASHTGNRVSFAIPHAKVEDILPKLRKTIRISRKPGDALNVSTYETRSDKWNSLFREFGHKAHNKKIPQWVMESTPEAKESFLEGFFDADGHFPYLGAVSVSTASPSVAYGIQRLLADFGLTPSVRFQKKNPTHVIEGRTVNQRDLWYVDAKIPINRPQVAHDDEYLWVPVKNIERYNTETTVYNFDVEEEHTYTVQNLATHNCHLYFQFISHELTLEQRVMIAQDQVELAKYDLEKKQRQTGMMDLALRTWTDWTHYQAQTKVSDEEFHLRLDEAGIHRRGLYCFLLLRSNDLGLGQPFNVAQYATLTHMVAQCVNMAPLELVWAAVDAHVYTNHVTALEHQLTLESKDCVPRLQLNPEVKSIDGFKISDLTIVDYGSHPALTKDMPVAV